MTGPYFYIAADPLLGCRILGTSRSNYSHIDIRTLPYYYLFDVYYTELKTRNIRVCLVLLPSTTESL